MMAEALSRKIKLGTERKNWIGLQIAPRFPPIMHQLFVDDMLLYGQSTMSEVVSIKQILEDYCAISGQSINKDKSYIYFFNSSELMQRRIEIVLGFPRKKSPSIYLGVPMFNGGVKYDL